MLGQDRHQAEDQRQFAVAGVAEIEPHRERVGRFGLCDLGIILAMVGTALVAQQGPGKQHVLGAHRLPVRETRQRIEMEGDVTPGVVGFHAFGQQAIQREGLVIAPRHQAFDHEAPLDAYPDLLHGDAPDDQRIEAVEGSEKALHQPAAFRRIGIGIGHMAEIGRQGRRAMHGDARSSGSADRLVGAGDPSRPEAEREDATDQGPNARAPRNPPTVALI